MDSEKKIEKPRNKNKKDIFIPIILIIVLGFAVYVNSLSGKFIWDDEALVKDNIYIKNWSNIGSIFSKNIGVSLGEKYYFYRPLQMFTYMIDYSLWKLNVKGYHLTNILLHILVALAIYWLLLIFYKNKTLSLFTSILFVVHPIHTEAVSYISGRADSLGAAFMLLSFVLYIKYSSSNNINMHIVALLSYVLGILSREQILIFPALLLLYHYAFNEKIRIKLFLPISAITFFYILLRLTAFRSLLPHTSSITTLSQRIPGTFVALTNYIRLLFLPFNLHMEYCLRLFKWSDLRVILGGTILLLLLMLAFNKRNNKRLIFFPTAWFLVTLIPQSNIYPINAYMAEHWLYLPSLGFFLVLADCFNRLYRNKNLKFLAIVLFIGLLVFYSSLTIKQNTYWREPLTFYERNLRYAPDSHRIINNLAASYQQINKPEEAIALYKKALELNPNYAITYYNMGDAYSSLGKIEEAKISFKKAIELNPSIVNAYNDLGLIYYKINQPEEAIALYKKALELDPDNAITHYNLGNAYNSMGDTEQAKAFYKKAIKINPDFPDLASAYNNLGLLYHEAKKYEEAIALYKKAIELNPSYAKAYNNLGNAYQGLNSYEQAIVMYKKAIELEPNYAIAYNNLAVVYYYNKQYDLAVKYYDRAVELGASENSEFANLLRPFHR